MKENEQEITLKEKNHHLLARLALWTSAIVWGSSFFIMKNTVDVFEPSMLLAIRFTIATIALCLLFAKRLKKLNRRYFIDGAIIGVFLCLAYIVQTIGLTDTTPGKNAFLTANYCVLVPFLFWALGGSKPDAFNYTAAFLGFAGIGLVSLSIGLSIRFGDLLTIFSGVLYAFQIVANAKLTKEKDPVLLTIIQLAVTSIICWGIALTTASFPSNISTSTWFGMLYLAIICSAVAILFMNYGTQKVDPSEASLIISLESVFGILFSVIFYNEILTPRLVIGFLMIFSAIIISETKLSFLFKSKSLPAK